ncbi:MAG: hypothetical protein J6386_11555 [Candidatus Synoicihabitans palmerolidicus]|nr:hypothetical protein [Candidatus Synoicihabitans palmerolidicus]
MDAIFEHGDDISTAQEVAEMFAAMWRDVPSALDRIELARNGGDIKAGQSRGHRLRGVIANYGMLSAANLLGRMENETDFFCRGSNLAAVRALISVGHEELFRRYPYLAAAS